VSTPIGIAVVGAGYWGPNLVRNAQATPGLQLEYLCDLDEARARQVLGGYSTVRVSTRLDEVLADPRVHAVAIATPAATHTSIALAAIEAGKHVLVEKPLAASYTDGLAVVRAADDAGVVLMLDHTYCYTPAVQRLRELLHGGELGALQYLDSVRINLGLVQSDVDVIWDLAPHDLSVLDAVLPPGVTPVSVAARGSDPLGCGQVCVAHLAIELSSGALAHVHVNWLSPTKIRTTIVGGSRRTVVWDDLNPAQRLSVYDRSIETHDPATLGVELRNQTRVSYRIGDMVAPVLPEREALRSMMAEFAAAITEGRPALTDGRSGLRVLAMLEAASCSLREGGRAVPVDTGDREELALGIAGA
jgi:predicted dehydrogenase